jgi:hypothetical protein
MAKIGMNADDGCHSGDAIAAELERSLTNPLPSQMAPIYRTSRLRQAGDAETPNEETE